MRYYFFAPETEGANNNVPHTAPVRDEQLDFLRTHLQGALVPLDMDTYANGPLIILGTLARSSYVLDSEAVLWCAEWKPGLLVVRFSPTDGMSWAAFRDPRPHFGGREPLPEDIAADLDEDDNPFYRLIFDSWDAQFEADHYKWIKARLATDHEKARFAAAMKVGDALPFEPGDMSDEERKAWHAQALKNIETFAGEGIRYWAS